MLLCIAGTLLNSDFATLDNAMNVLTRTAFIGIIAVGMCFVIISGGIDLSVGSMAALIAGCVILLMNALAAGVLGSPVLVGRARAWRSPLVLGAAFGLAHGLLITKGRIEPFIVTLGTLGIFRAYLTYFANGGAITLDNSLADVYSPVYYGSLLGMPIPVWVFVLVALARRADPQPHRVRPLRAGDRLQRAGGALRRRRRRPREDPDLHAARRVRGHRHAAVRAAPRLGLAHHRPAVGAGGDRRGDRRRHRAARAAPAASPAR